MNNEAFIRGFMDEMEKDGVALDSVLALAPKLLQGGKSLIGGLMKRVGPKLLQSGGGLGREAMSQGSKGGNIAKPVNIASNLSGMADIIRARNPKQPANAGNTITRPQ